jgi:methionyl aminopeptidase
MNDDKIAAMREGGRVLGTILQELLGFSRPGTSLLDIEALAQKRIVQAGMKPSFSTVANYQWATCLCVNEVIVHGIPTGYRLKEGDLLTIDIGLINRGFHVDTAWTKVVGGKDDTFLEVGQEALKKAIDQAKAGNRVGHISKAIQEIIEGAGYGVVKTLVGHGVGKTLHEPPQIPGFVRGSIEKTPRLTVGMTIAIEVIYAMGSPAITYYDDGWSIATRDHSLSAVFEQTIAVTDSKPLILTPAPLDEA